MHKNQPDVKQLSRLSVLLDIICGLTIWQLFLLLPRPGEGETLGFRSVAELVSANWHIFLVVCIGIVIAIIYWIQNNALFSILERTDTIHNIISVFQVVFVMFLLYTIMLGVEFEGDRGALFLESLATFLIGLCSFTGWRYAKEPELNNFRKWHRIFIPVLGREIGA